MREGVSSDAKGTRMAFQSERRQSARKIDFVPTYSFRFRCNPFDTFIRDPSDECCLPEPEDHEGNSSTPQRKFYRP